MADLTPLIPNADGTNTSAQTTEATFWQAVNTDPTTNPTPASYIWGAANAAAETFFGLTDVDSDFGSMDTLSIEAAVVAASFNDDSSDLFAQVFASDETTPYTDEITLAQVVSGTLQGTSPYTGNFTLNAAGQAATKADWSSIFLQLRWNYNKQAGNDNGQLRVQAVELNGTYTAEAAAVLTADQGSFTLSGQDAGLPRGYILTAEQGSFAETGQDAVLTHSGTYAYDLFEDTNGTLLSAHTMDVGPGWSGSTGNAEIQSNALQLTANNALVFVETNRSLVDVRIRWTPASGSREAVVVRYIDANNYWWLNVREPEGDVRLFKTVGGINTVVRTSSFSWVAGNTYRIQVSVGASNLWFVAINGVSPFSNPTDAALRTGTKHGVSRRTSVSSPSIDSFAVTQSSDKNYTLIAAQASFALSGQDAELTTGAEATLTAEQGSFTVTGQDANLHRGLFLTAEQASFTQTGQDTALVADRTLTAEEGSFTLTGENAALTTAGAETLSVDHGEFTLTGQDAALTTDRTLTAEQASFSLTGQDATLSKGYVLSHEVGYAVKAVVTFTDETTAETDEVNIGVRTATPYTLTGQDTVLTTARTLTADQATFTLTGQDVTLSADRTVSLEAGSFTLTGEDATLSADRTLSLEPGSFTLTGQDAELTVVGAFELTADEGTFTLTGQDTSLQAGRDLTAEQGSFSVAGQDTEFTTTRTLTAESGSFTLAGQPADLQTTGAFALSAESGSFTLTGEDATLSADHTAVAEQGSYTLTGQDVTLSAGRSLSADSGTLNLTGQDADLTYTPVVGFTLEAESGSFSLTGEIASLEAARILAAEQGSLTLTGAAAILAKGIRLAAEPGSYALDGNVATLLAARTILLTHGTFSLNGIAATLSYSEAKQIATIELTLSDVMTLSATLSDVYTIDATLEDAHELELTLQD